MPPLLVPEHLTLNFHGRIVYSSVASSFGHSNTCTWINFRSLPSEIALSGGHWFGALNVWYVFYFVFLCQIPKKQVPNHSDLELWLEVLAINLEFLILLMFIRWCSGWCICASWSDRWAKNRSCNWWAWRIDFDFVFDIQVDGQLKQKGSTNDMIFSIPVLVSYISTIMTLNEGDIILTGNFFTLFESFLSIIFALNRYDWLRWLCPQEDYNAVRMRWIKIGDLAFARLYLLGSRKLILGS